MKKMMKKFKNERGLTLVELLAVVVILAIIAVIAFVLIGNVIENSKKDAHIANAQQLIASAKLYEANGEEIGTGVTSKDLSDADLLDKLINPWTKSESNYEGEVTKNADGIYSVTLDASGKCNINGVDEPTLISGDRKTICPN